MNAAQYKLIENTAVARPALIIGIAGLVVGVGGFVVNRSYFFHSYLISFAFWTLLALGGIFFTMLHHLVAATWSIVFRRISENIMTLAIPAAIFFIPIIFGIGDLYHWSHKGDLIQDAVLRGKTAYLNSAFFIIRTAIYFTVWLFLSLKLYKLSIAQDMDTNNDLVARLRKISAPGMVLFAFTLTFASFDWFMSLEAHWYSTVFGVYIFAGSTLSMLAFITIMAVNLKNSGILSEVITEEHFHDLGKLLFTFVVFWGYIAFAQYFLIWYGNIPEETIWYRERWEGVWRFISLLLVFGHFVFPFMVLITRSAKRNTSIMRFMAFWLLFMQWADLYWVIMPNFGNDTFKYLWIDLGTMSGIGGFFLWYFYRRLVSQPVIPVFDPDLEASINLISD
jgi:hypothetical protein